MNVVKIMGGLGNQLYQYAFGKVMENNGQDVCYDISWYNKNVENRGYLLDKFVYPIKLGKFLKQHTVHEVNYNKDIFKLRNRNFYGYWQYLDYYRKYNSLFKTEITLSTTQKTTDYLMCLDKINNSMSIGIHVRRGDYLGKNFQVLPFAYYAEAIRYFYDRISSSSKEPLQFFLFSDDIEWCKQHFSNVNIVHLESYLDFELLRACKHQIISSSTFSWWAAWLNTNPDKIVICPEQYIVRKEDVHNYDNKIHYPVEWVKLFNYVNN